MTVARKFNRESFTFTETTELYDIVSDDTTIIVKNGDLHVPYGTGDRVTLVADGSITIDGDIGHNVTIRAGDKIEFQDAGDNLHIKNCREIRGETTGRDAFIKAAYGIIVMFPGPSGRLEAPHIYAHKLRQGSILIAKEATTFGREADCIVRNRKGRVLE